MPADWSRQRGLFGALVLAQVAHSIEEYRGRLWESFPPARWLTSLMSSNLERGLLLLNIGLAAFGAWCLMWPVRRRWRSARGLMAGWAAVEIINGIGHPLWAPRRGGYTPGVATAPLLLVLAKSLGIRLRWELPAASSQ